MKKLFALFLCAALVMGALSGCGGEEEAYTPTGDGLSSAETTRPTSPGVTEQELSLPYYPSRSLNPYECGDYTNRTLFSLVYQGLFAVDADYEVYPILCKSYTVSRDMKTYTFFLEEASFSDGTAVTAADVAASLKKAKESPVYRGRFGYVDSVSTGENGSVIVKLETPYENLPLLLDVPIVKKGEVGAKRPMGTGPYLFESHEEELWLRRRTDWWCDASLPVTAAYITLTEGQSNAQLRDEFEFSGLGLVTADPGSDKYVDFHGDYELWDCETGIFMYLGCNMDSPVFSQDGIRAALIQAFDRSALAEAYYKGFAYGATLPASPQSPYYDAALAAKYPADPSKLTQAVSAAALEDNTVVLLVNTDDGVRLRVARDIAKTLTACGLKTKLSELSGDLYRSALEKGEYDLYLGQTKLSANMDLSAFFDREGALNYGDLGSTAMSALCRDALANSGNYYTLYQRILDDGRLCPILFRSYAIYAQRGQFSDLTPARDNVFFYQLGKTVKDALVEA